VAQADVKRLKALESENAKLKWLLAERDLDIDVMRAAQVVIEAWRQHYDAVRPDSSRRYLTPHEYKRHDPAITITPRQAVSET
jgi:hypothetical protein